MPIIDVDNAIIPVIIRITFIAILAETRIAVIIRIRPRLILKALSVVPIFAFIFLLNEIEP